MTPPGSRTRAAAGRGLELAGLLQGQQAGDMAALHAVAPPEVAEALAGALAAGDDDGVVGVVVLVVELDQADGQAVGALDLLEGVVGPLLALADDEGESAVGLLAEGDAAVAADSNPWPPHILVVPTGTTKEPAGGGCCL